MYGAHRVIDAELEFFANSKAKIDTCMNYTRPSLAVILEPIRKAFLDAKNRGVKLRYLTEITLDNKAACKELMTIVELRHLDGIKGNFMVSETEYLAPLILFERGKIASQIIFSNVKEVLDQHQYMFDTLWNKAISAQQRIREIDEGIVSYETKVLEEDEKKLEQFKLYLENSRQLSVCTQDNRLQFVYNNFFKVIENILDKFKNGEHNGIRWLTYVKDKNSANLAKIFLEYGVVVRHINQIPISFGVSDIEVVGSIANTEGNEMAKTLFVSNEPLYVKHFNSLFEELWKNGIDAKDRIRDIEVGAELADVEVIPMSTRAKDLYLNLVKKAEKEIILMFPTTNAFIRQKNIGVIQFSEEAAREHNVKVRILMPPHTSTEDIVRHLKENYAECFDIRYIEKMSDTKATILIIDRKVSLVMELRDDSKRTFDEAIGLSTYSNSRPGVLSYVSIFENLWKQTELYEQLKTHDRMQQEFINIAAHELRTPIQPIISLTEILRSQIKDVKQQEILDVTIRNAERLQRLTNDILDVTKIEGRSLELNKVVFNLNDILINAINDITLGRNSPKNENLRLSYNHHPDVLIQADKERISQVISNLLDNAIKFTSKGTILVSVEKDKRDNSEDNKYVIVNVRDSGQGIDSSILPRLFTKFASKSYKGTGLGLFISKAIIEAHGGKIWGENNSDGRGATFSFSLPLGENR
ncbi:MAG TPA: HAMP domain-containing sensor histidine kinase [Candidatus Nitrosopolaris sp.]|nr:HAMP domain-containing sensor histidine kinase [Candidatus Nitrosopolaris sp.]